MGLPLDAGHGRLDIARLAVLRVARQTAMGLDRLAAAREDGDAVPALLAVPDRAIAGLLDRGRGKAVFGRLQFLEAGDVGPCLGQPVEQQRQAAVDAVDVEGGDLHPGETIESAPGFLS
jgi:hypothetical protein